MSATHCPECHRAVAGGLEACQRDFDALQARALAEPSTYAMHRLLVDAYSLQHPERYMKSARSYAAHLTSMLAATEHGSDPAAMRTLQQWLSHGPALEKPPLPQARGEITIAEALATTDRVALDRALRAWAESAWAAYAPWHELARGWAAQAFARR